MAQAIALRASCALALLVAAAPAAAATASKASDRSRIDGVPVKDCTRLNGRNGYYGNPWCSPAEQRRWDLWQSRRLRAGRGAS